MSRNEFIDVKTTMNTKEILRINNIIGVYESSVPCDTDPETEVLMSSGERVFIAEEYSDFCNRLFAL